MTFLKGHYVKDAGTVTHTDQTDFGSDQSLRITPTLHVAANIAI